MVDRKVESDFRVKANLFNTIPTATAAKKDDLIPLLQSFHVCPKMSVTIIMQFYAASAKHGHMKLE